MQSLYNLRLFPVRVGKVGFALALDLIERRFRNVDIPLPNEGGRETVEHGENQGADLEAVHIRIGADDDLVPAEIFQAEGGQILGPLVLHLHTAAQHPHEIGDDVALKNAGVIRLEAVEDFAADGHDALKLRIARELAGAQGGIALHDVNLPAGDILGAAVHELLHPVGEIQIARELLFQVLAGLLRLLAAALVDEHLLENAVSLGLVLDKINLQLFLEKGGHGLLNEFVGDGLLRLVLIGGNGGKAVGNQNQAVLNVLKGDFTLVFLILSLLLDVCVDGGGKGAACGLFRRAAMLQPGGVVVILDQIDLVGKAKRGGNFHLIFRLVRAILAPALGFDV